MKMMAEAKKMLRVMGSADGDDDDNTEDDAANDGEPAADGGCGNNEYDAANDER